MKAVLLFAVFTVMAHGVCSNNLLHAIPQDINLPELSTPKPRRTGSGRIVGGKEITKNERKLYKYQVGLKYPDDDYNWCGGSIISERSIITAAHCLENAISVSVYIGLYDKSKLTNSAQSINITKKNWVLHPDYDNVNVVNDLAIINLPEPIKFGEFVGPIEVECDDKQRHVNEKVSISGWGRHSDSGDKKTTILRAAVVQTAPNHVCQSSFGRLFLSTSMICVYGTNTIGACNADSGGPIVSTINGKLLGATSYGADGCEQDSPRVFTRLSYFAKWIQDNTVDHIKNC